jgi:pimeloyl-ACP methyl ester carboxylesterase
MLKEEDLQSLDKVSAAEAARFRRFLESYRETTVELNGKNIPYRTGGQGRRTLLTFAGGWGGTELAFDLALGLSGRNRVLVIDISAFDDPDEMARGVLSVIEREKAGQLVVVGQSLAGIIGQSFFRRHYPRIDGLVLTNTLWPRPERSKKWAAMLFAMLPLALLKRLLRRKMSRLSAIEKAMPPEVQERRKFAMALLGCMVDGYWSKKGMNNVLRLALAFNERDGYAADSFPGWQGRALVVTSPDDPYYADAGLLMNSLPNAQKHEFPSGFGHMAPQVFRDEYFGLIQAFIDRLDERTI